MKKSFILITSLCIGMAATAQNFNPSNLVVFRAGDGTASIATNIAAPIVIDEFTVNGTLVQSVALPTVTNGNNKRILTSGTSTSEGQITRSTNGLYLLAMGYDADLGTVGTGTTSLSGSPTATTNRIIARIDYAKDINTTTALSDVISGNTRSCVSDDGNNLWFVGGGGGVGYNTLGAPNPSISVFNGFTNIRTINIFDNQLYIGTASGTNRLAVVGTGLPTTTGQTVTAFNGITNTNLVSPYQFVMFDVNANVPGPDVLYVVDDGAGSNATPGIFKYSLVDGTWVSNGVVDATAGYRGLTGKADGNTISLYAIKGANSLMSVVDESGYNNTFNATPTTLATAPSGTAFRGVCFAPSATPLPVNLLSFNAKRNGSILNTWWSTSYEAQSAVFEIEVSNDGITYRTVGTVTAKNTIQLNNYQYSLNVDNDIQFVRLKMIDKDGKFNYSQALKLEVYNGNSKLSVYPNPVANQITVQHPIAVATATIQIADVVGKIIYSSKVSLQSTFSNIDVTQLQKGKYTVTFKQGTESKTIGFIKL